MVYLDTPLGNRFEKDGGGVPVWYRQADRYVSTALTLRQIVERCDGLDHPYTLWKYYERTHQLGIRRRDKPLCRKEISKIIGFFIDSARQRTAPIAAYLLQLAQILVYIRASDAEKKTFEHFQSVSWTKYSWETLEEAFTRYFTAKKSRKKQSLRQLTEGLDIPLIGLSRVFNSVGLEPMYRTKKKKYEEKAQEKQEFSHIEEMVKKGVYSKDSIAMQKTFEFFIFCPSSSYYAPKSVLGLVTGYIDAKIKGKKLLTDELGGGAIRKDGVKKILKFFGWGSICKTPERLTTEQKKTLQRIFPLPVSASDIAGFMGLTYQGVSKGLSKIGKRPFSLNLVSYLGPIRTNMLASNIYYALDSGLSTEETAEYYETTIKMVGHAREQRQTIEPRIMHILGVIYPHREIKKPYLEELL